MAGTRETLAQVRAEREDARRWAVRLEGERASALERVGQADARAVGAIQRQDETLMKLSTTYAERDAFRQQRDEVVAALGVISAVLDSLRTGEKLDADDGYRLERVRETATRLLKRYRRPAPATIESHGTPE